MEQKVVVESEVFQAHKLLQCLCVSVRSVVMPLFDYRNSCRPNVYVVIPTGSTSKCCWLRNKGGGHLREQNILTPTRRARKKKEKEKRVDVVNVNCNIPDKK